jgi:hypothetical protein
MPYPRCRTTATPRSLCKHATEHSGSTASLQCLGAQSWGFAQGCVGKAQGSRNLGHGRGTERNGSEEVRRKTGPPSCSARSAAQPVGGSWRYRYRHSGLPLIGEGRLPVPGGVVSVPPTPSGDITTKAQMGSIASARGEHDVLTAPGLSPNPGCSGVPHFGNVRKVERMKEQMSGSCRWVLTNAL